jgi:acetyl-CoA acetyltransferase
MAAERERWEHGAIVSGVGLSQVGRRLGRASLDLTVEACLRAIDDAGLTRQDIDGLATYPGAGYPLTYGGPLIPELQDALRLELDWHRGSSEGPGTLQALMNAVMAVGAGAARHVLVYKATTETSPPISPPPGSFRSIARASGGSTWAPPFGAISAANWSAIFANRHFHEYGTTREQLGMIPLTLRTNAALNPDAVYRTPLTLDDYLGARMISEPLTLYDCDVPADGCVAFVVSHRDFAADCRSTPVALEAVGTAMRGRPWWDQRDDLTTMMAHDAAAQLWSRTELRPSDVDTAHLYDGFSILTLLWIEALGFCGHGEGGPFVEGGTRIARDGELPLSPDGGQLSAARLHGYGHFREACLQLRGEAGDRQVAHKRSGTPEVALVAIGAGPTAGCLLLTRGVG